MLSKEKTMEVLEPAQIDAFYARLLASGLTPLSVRKSHAVLSAAFAQVMRWGWLDRNPLLRASPPTTRGREHSSTLAIRPPLGGPGTCRGRAQGRRPSSSLNAGAGSLLSRVQPVSTLGHALRWGIGRLLCVGTGSRLRSSPLPLGREPPP